MWMLPLYLHVNQKSDYDDDDGKYISELEYNHYWKTINNITHLAITGIETVSAILLITSFLLGCLGRSSLILP